MLEHHVHQSAMTRGTPYRTVPSCPELWQTTECGGAYTQWIEGHPGGSLVERTPRGSLSTKYGGPCDTPDVGTISSAMSIIYKIAETETENVRAAKEGASYTAVGQVNVDTNAVKGDRFSVAWCQKLGK